MVKDNCVICRLIEQGKISPVGTGVQDRAKSGHIAKVELHYSSADTNRHVHRTEYFHYACYLAMIKPMTEEVAQDPHYKGDKETQLVMAISKLFDDLTDDPDTKLFREGEVKTMTTITITHHDGKEQKLKVLTK